MAPKGVTGNCTVSRMNECQVRPITCTTNLPVSGWIDGHDGFTAGAEAEADVVNLVHPPLPSHFLIGRGGRLKVETGYVPWKCDS